jgi:hypothetical protein
VERRAAGRAGAGGEAAAPACGAQDDNFPSNKEMTMDRASSQLDSQGQSLLALLVGKLQSGGSEADQAFIGYKAAHIALGLTQIRETWGESLKAQGLTNLADWTASTGKPGITGLIIDTTDKNEPAGGYFRLFGKRPGDLEWWLKQINLSRSFDWSPYLPMTLPPDPPEPPTAIDIDEPSNRQKSITYRIIRDTLLARRVKEMHNYSCQLCGHFIALANGSRYAEAHHIRPLGRPHDGPDRIENIMCLCPNHHAEMDLGFRKVSASDLRSVPGHAIDEQYIGYHNEIVYGKP